MQIVTYKYRVKDRNAQKTLRAHANACNQVWNYCNAVQRDIENRYCAGAPKRPWPTHYDLQKLCKGVGKELGINQQTVACVCNKFAESRDKVKRSLRFRSSFGSKRMLGWIPFQKQSRQIEGNSIWYVGKRYRFFGSKRRPLPDNAKGGYFVEDAQGHWFVCFHIEVKNRCSHGSCIIGIDLGLSTLITISDGRKIDAPRYYRHLETKLAIAQRNNNKKRVRRIHANIKNARKDFAHKLSTNLADQNALIAVGNVNSKQLAKTRMAKSVLDAGWSMFRTMLKYKSTGYVEVDERFTTVTCSACSARSGPQGQKGLRIRQWQCSTCGENHDRDVNSALNILAIAARSASGPVVESCEAPIGGKNG